MRHTSKPGLIYLIDVDAYNAGIPYADSFYVVQHYCLTKVNPNDPDFVPDPERAYTKFATPDIQRSAGLVCITPSRRAP